MFNFKFWKKENKAKCVKSPMDVCAVPGDGPLFLTTTDEATLAQMDDIFGKDKLKT